MTLRYLLLGLILLVLQACQYNNEPSHVFFSQKSKHPEAALRHMQLGLAYLNQGDRVRAKQKLMRALEEAPNSASVNAAIGYFMEQTGEIKQARFYYDKAVRCEPSGAHLNNYGAFLCRNKQYIKAEHYFKKAIQDKQYIHTATVYENAGFCALASANDKKAVHYFKQALLHDPLRKQSLYELVRIEVKLGQYHLALANLTQYHATRLNDPALNALIVDVKQKMKKLNYSP